MDATAIHFLSEGGIIILDDIKRLREESNKRIKGIEDRMKQEMEFIEYCKDKGIKRGK